MLLMEPDLSNSQTEKWLLKFCNIKNTSLMNKAKNVNILILAINDLEMNGRLLVCMPALGKDNAPVK